MGTLQRENVTASFKPWWCQMWRKGPWLWAWDSRASRFPAGEGALLRTGHGLVNRPGIPGRQGSLLGKGPFSELDMGWLTAGFLGVLLTNFPFRLRLPAPAFPEDKPLRSTSCSLLFMLLCKYLTFPVSASEHIGQVIFRKV